MAALANNGIQAKLVATGIWHSCIVSNGVVSVFQLELAIYAVLVVLLSNRNHQLNTVELVNLGRTWVVVDSNNVGLGVHLAQALDDCLANNVVR